MNSVAYYLSAIQPFVSLQETPATPNFTLKLNAQPDKDLKLHFMMVTEDLQGTVETFVKEISFDYFCPVMQARFFIGLNKNYNIHYELESEAQIKEYG